jgi:hypothetical protein
MSNRGRKLQAATTGNSAHTEDSKMTPVESTVAEPKLTKKTGKTRGRSPRPIEYDVFDLEQPETLPKTLASFVAVTGADEPKLLSYVIDGFNQAQYAEASDEIGEFVNDAWDKETAAQFRLIVRNYAKAANKSIEEAANLMTPAIQAGFEARKAAAAIPATAK